MLSQLRAPLARKIPLNGSKLTGIHFLMTYSCSAECDHCFVWCSPRQGGPITVEQINRFLGELAQVPQVTSLCGEGGEPFLFLRELSHLVGEGTGRGYQVSALTNAFWAVSDDAARRILGPLRQAGLASLGISTDCWHERSVPRERVERALRICEELGIKSSKMVTEMEGVMFRGRAAARLSSCAAEMTPWQELTECGKETLAEPGRVHLDRCGGLHLCQGLLMGDAVRGIAAVIQGYDPRDHPVVRPLSEGGPRRLAEEAMSCGFQPRPTYAGGCHLCYEARKFLRARWPELLAPDEMYGGQWQGAPARSDASLAHRVG
jgi:hypothetical protein